MRFPNIRALTMRPPTMIVLPVLLAATVLIGCDDTRGGRMQAPDSLSVDATPNAARPDSAMRPDRDTYRRNPAAPSLGELLPMVSSDGSYDIMIGILAAAQSGRADVREYAAMVMEDCTLLRDSIETLIGRMRIATRWLDDDEDLKLKSVVRESLISARGEEFDRIYVGYCITNNRRLLDMIDRASAGSGEAAEVLSHSRAIVGRHLDRAIELERGAQSTGARR